MAGNDIYLRSVPSDADQDDIRLYDPTVADAGGPAGANFAGTTTITFSQTGDLTAPATFVGATTVTFTQSGDLDAPAIFAGTTTIAFDQSGAFTAPATLSGTATVTFDQTGDFSAGAAGGAANFEGTASITFAAVGDFSTGASSAIEEQERRGGAGHSVRYARYWKGQYAGYYNDIEWVEWLLAALAGDVVEKPVLSKPTPSRKIRREVVEPEAYIEKAYPESIGALLELKIEHVLALAEQQQSAQVAKLAQAALYKKRRQDEEDDMAFLLLMS